MGKVPITGINHVCVVTADLDRAMRAWHERYGVGPWTHYTFDADDMEARVGGERVDCAIRVAAAPLGDAGQKLELIQPLDERGPWAESLAAHAGADHLHHVRFDVTDFDEAAAALTDGGAPLGLDADFTGDPAEPPLRCNYFATAPTLGFTIELGEAPPGFALANPDGTFPAEG
jgi:methylmalonyl-CoA/ethylmalonyl-CoA epimerase